MPDYGIDAPGVVRNLAILGPALVIAALAIPGLRGSPLRVSMIVTGAVLCVESVLMLLYAKIGKFRHRDRILSMREWRGDEVVLDVGTGRGLLAIGAAKRLATGRAIGIDIWQSSDLSGNTIEATRRNAELEGVAAKVELRSEDARAMKSLGDASVDVVVSNLCLHNIPSRAGRADACREIARVLKPGGVALISDFKSTGLYARTFREAGLAVTRGAPAILTTFPPLRIVVARRPM